MACSPFIVDFEGDADALFAKINEEVLANDGTVTGDANNGTFTISIPLGHISGDYSIVGQQLTVTISHKPFLIGCGTIESGARDRLLAL